MCHAYLFPTLHCNSCVCVCVCVCVCACLCVCVRVWQHIMSAWVVLSLSCNVGSARMSNRFLLSVVRHVHTHDVPRWQFLPSRFVFSHTLSYRRILSAGLQLLGELQRGDVQCGDWQVSAVRLRSLSER